MTWVSAGRVFGPRRPASHAREETAPRARGGTGHLPAIPREGSHGRLSRRRASFQEDASGRLAFPLCVSWFSLVFVFLFLTTKGFAKGVKVVGRKTEFEGFSSLSSEYRSLSQSGQLRRRASRGGSRRGPRGANRRTSMRRAASRSLKQAASSKEVWAPAWPKHCSWR